MRKETIDNVLVRIFGTIFGLGIALIGLILFFIGIAFCTTIIGIIVGIPMIFCSFAFVPGGIAGAFEMAVKGKAEFKFLEKIKKAYTAKIEIEPEPETKDLRGRYTMFKIDNSYINN